MNALNSVTSARVCVFCGSPSHGAHGVHPQKPKLSGKKAHYELKLFACAMSGDIEGVKKMVAAGVNVNALSVVSDSPVYGPLGHNTALMFAAAARKGEVAAFLLNRGADPSLRNLAGETAHAIALLNGDREMMALLQGAMKRWHSANDEYWGEDRVAA